MHGIVRKCCEALRESMKQSIINGSKHTEASVTTEDGSIDIRSYFYKDKGDDVRVNVYDFNYRPKDLPNLCEAIVNYAPEWRKEIDNFIDKLRLVYGY